MSFSLQCLPFPPSTGSGHVGFSSYGSHVLEHRLSICGTWVLLLRGMWDLPIPGIKPVSPALSGGFISSVPLGKPCRSFLKYLFL